MNRVFRQIRFLPIAIVLAISLVGSAGYAHFTAAAPGNGEPQYRLAAIDSGGHVEHYVLVNKAVHRSPGTTPVASDMVCFDGDPTLMAAQLFITGTMTGSAPVVTVVLQVSDNRGQTWRQVGSSFAAINATVTPAAGVERVAFSDVAASTAIVWGDCFRTLTTWVGTATVTSLDYGVTLYGK